MSMQSYNTHNLRISRLALGSPKTKSHFNIILPIRSKVYYKKEGGDLLPSPGWMNNESKASSWPKVHFIPTNHLHVNFILTNHLHNLTCVNDLIERYLWMYQFILIPILELPHTFFLFNARNWKLYAKIFFFLLSFNCNILGIHLPSFRKNLKVHHLGINVFANGFNAQTNIIYTRGDTKLRLMAML
jgi:hypothetical protein